MTPVFVVADVGGENVGIVPKGSKCTCDKLTTRDLVWLNGQVTRNARINNWCIPRPLEQSYDRVSR